MAEVFKQGYLTKSPPAGALKSWKKRYFVLKGQTLMYFVNEEEYTKQRPMKGEIEVLRCSRIERGQDPKVFQFSIILPERTYVLQAETDDERESWITELSKHITTLAKDLIRSATKAGPSTGDVSIGSQITVWTSTGHFAQAIMRYFGKHHKSGKLCCGVEFLHPIGKHNGTVDGHTYFECKDGHGALVSPLKVAPNDQVNEEDVGRRVTVWGYTSQGTLRYLGPHHKDGAPRCGVEFDKPVGLNNGTIDDHKYFECKARHGVLVHPVKVTLMKDGEAPVHREAPEADGADEEEEEEGEGDTEGAPEIEAVRVYAAGWLLKRGGGRGHGRMEGSVFARKNWKKRWFVLKDTVLKYYKSKAEAERADPRSLGWIDINEEVEIRPDAENNLAFTIITPRRTYCLVCSEFKDVSNWLSTLHEACAQAQISFHDY